MRGGAVDTARRVTAREKLYNFLEARAGGASSDELIGQLFSGRGSDPEIGSRLIHHLLADDPNFVRDGVGDRWALARDQALRIPADQAHYVVVDLETTGGRAGPGTIIEIGAYRMRGLRIEESFASLIRPCMRIPSFVSRLTSITNEMVADAPPIEDVLPRFRMFLGDAVMVAHNAQFDFGFLDCEFRRLFGIGLLNPVLCTLRLARRLLPSVRRKRLDALAEHFGLSTEGRHRGLGDARMAAELLAIFIESAVHLGIGRLDRLLEYQHQGSSQRRIERHVPPEVIAAIPREPGVYLMRNERGDLLYVGKAKRLRDRVASYFNGGMGLRPKVIELINHVHAIETRIARSSLEAALLEAQLIRELKPPYNRMLKSAPTAHFVRIDLRDEFPRLSLSPRLSNRPGLIQLGPFIGRRNPDHAVRALSRLLGLRTCTGKLEPSADVSPCIYGQMGHCAAPCNRSIDEDRYGAQARRAIEFMRGRSWPILSALAQARDRAAATMRFEEAARHKRDLEAVRILAIRNARLSQAVSENNLVIVTGAEGNRAAYVVLGGRLACTRELDSPAARSEVAAFVAANYQRYRSSPIARDELDAMAIVSRWLRERDPDESRLIWLDGPRLEPASLSDVVVL
jgi:DNA polymerase-3 subunit epsilon